jgi:acyl carrier protein
MINTGRLDRAIVTAAVVDAIEQSLRRDLPGIDDDTRLFDELSLSSTGLLVALVNLEHATGIRIDPETMTEEHMATLGGLVDCALDNTALDETALDETASDDAEGASSDGSSA